MSFMRKLLVGGSIASLAMSMSGCPTASWLKCGKQPPPPVVVETPEPPKEPPPAPKVVCKNTSVYFDTDKHEVRSEGLTALAELADCLAKNDQAVEIHGYADLRYTVPYNIALSERRANSVVDALTGKGLVKTRIKSVTGHGKTEQFGKGRSSEALQNNRVVVIEIKE
jgi:outer membrane protein OmpA-like peptidoglycan-associated protein